MAHAFFLGVDVVDDDQADQGACTLTLIEKEKERTDDRASYRLDSIAHRSSTPSADEVAEHIQGLVADVPYIGRTSIIVNRRTDLGQEIVDALEERGLAPVAATLTGGMGATAGDTDEVGVHIAEYDAVETLATLYHEGRIDLLARRTEDASRLARGIQSFVAYVTDEEEATEAPETVTESPQRPESYDNYVTSAALAAWLGAERSFDPTQHLKEEPQTESPGPSGRP